MRVPKNSRVGFIGFWKFCYHQRSTGHGHLYPFPTASSIHNRIPVERIQLAWSCTKSIAIKFHVKSRLHLIVERRLPVKILPARCTYLANLGGIIESCSEPQSHLD